MAGCATIRDLRLRFSHIELAGLGRRLQVGILHGQAPRGCGGLAEAPPDAHQVAALQMELPSEGDSMSRSALAEASAAWEVLPALDSGLHVLLFQGIALMYIGRPPCTITLI